MAFDFASLRIIADDVNLPEPHHGAFFCTYDPATNVVVGIGLSFMESRFDAGEDRERFHTVECTEDLYRELDAEGGTVRCELLEDGTADLTADHRGYQAYRRKHRGY